MTLEQGIKHLEETLNNPDHKWSCAECKAEHEQLLAWLKELKDYREEKRTCEFCKHQNKAEFEYPCSVCRNNHPNMFEWEKKNEATND